jgi:SAM-dependent methyltransferase
MKPWNGVGEAYAASYASLCAGAIDALRAVLGPGEGRTLLDVGSGTGDLVARLSLDGWGATGCEPEPTMRAVAHLAHPEARFVDGRLPRLPFDEHSFDAVTANFVLNHVDDPRASAAELIRVARPSARLAATVWVASSSWFWIEVCDRAGLAPETGERLPAELDFARTAPGFGTMLAESGWREVGASELTWAWEVSPAALWASAEGGVASAGLFYGRLDGTGRALFRRGFDEACAAHARDGVVSLAHTAAVAVGRAP